MLDRAYALLEISSVLFLVTVLISILITNFQNRQIEWNSERILYRDHYDSRNTIIITSLRGGNDEVICF